MSSSKNRLSELMDYFKIKQIDIAEKTGIPKSAISMYTNGQRTPRQNRLTIIADAYGLNEAWLMGYDVPMFKDKSKEIIQEKNTGEMLGELFQTDSMGLTKLIQIFREMTFEQRNQFLLAGDEILKRGG